jgi:hypothetical protein
MSLARFGNPVPTTLRDDAAQTIVSGPTAKGITRNV